ncbi:hypothetical protein DAEQUDRAFT_170774 [Daedalea quercina L-15889]|uniref:Uncharacterized protein n=1 Tax=Daedalea quercina L-15889 TaxID=1314783 RepID=A0A165RKA6_9APHY|nr:hypothetical protein DAEQUDRAFT_170774 [Daedalea quercina L-15889]
MRGRSRWRGAKRVRRGSRKRRAERRAGRGWRGGPSKVCASLAVGSTGGDPLIPARLLEKLGPGIRKLNIIAHGDIPRIVSCAALSRCYLEIRLAAHTATQPLSSICAPLVRLRLSPALAHPEMLNHYREPSEMPPDRCAVVNALAWEMYQGLKVRDPGIMGITS